MHCGQSHGHFLVVIAVAITACGDSSDTGASVDASSSSTGSGGSASTAASTGGASGSGTSGAGGATSGTGGASGGAAGDGVSGAGGAMGGTGGDGTGGSAGNGTGGAGGSAGQALDASKPDTGIADATSDAPPCDTDGSCGSMSCCYQDRCIANGQTCDAGNVCFFTPVMGASCQACGHAGQPCCAGNVCVDASRCTATPQGYRCTN
jgi:hypothetical protein